jgi:hypothetical protein
MALTDQELDKLLAVLSPTGTDFQAGRIVRLLAKGPNRTGIICALCSVGNIPDVIAKSINPKIMPLGFFVSCVKPPMVIRNQFGQVAGDWIYTLYRADKAANDGTDGIRTRDPQGSSVDDWAKELEVVFKDNDALDLSCLDDLLVEHDLAKVGAT